MLLKPLIDYLLAFSTAIIALSAIVLGSFLWRYQQLGRELDTSSRLAKDVWDSVNSRFSVMDSRLIDLMAKTEVLYSKASSPQAAMQGPQPKRVTSRPASQEPALESPVPGSTRLTTAAFKPQVKVDTTEGTETEQRILLFLVQRPKTSAEIVDEVGLTREHTGRLMKSLFLRGLVTRNEENKPYVYELTEAGRATLPG